MQGKFTMWLEVQRGFPLRAFECVSRPLVVVGWRKVNIKGSIEMEALTNKSLTSVSQGRLVTLAVTTPPPWLEFSKSGRVQYLGTGISNFCFFKQEQVDWGDLIENHQQQNYKMHVPTISLSSALCVFVLISYVCFDILNYDECLFINKSIWSLQSGLFQIFWMCEQNNSCAPKTIVFLNFPHFLSFQVVGQFSVGTV